MSEQLGEAGDGEARSLLRQQFRRVMSLQTSAAPGAAPAPSIQIAIARA
jgi:hypothetical protein